MISSPKMSVSVQITIVISYKSFYRIPIRIENNQNTTNNTSEQVIGYGLTVSSFGFQGYMMRLEDLYVLPLYRNRSIGKSIIRHLTEVKTTLSCIYFG